MTVDTKIIVAWLNSIYGMQQKNIEKLVDYFGSIEGVWDNLDTEVNNINFIREEKLRKIIRNKSYFEEEFSNMLYKEGVSITTFLSDDYPEKLRDIINPPSILYCKGSMNSLNNISIAIVGSRKATDYGKWVADKFARELSNINVTIISGLATGIDTIAHKSSLKNNGTTIGVIGNGINICYPAKNENLYQEIISNGGCVVTEYPFDTQPMASNFPNRNRIISGLSSGILVVEAQDKSGTLITASHAADQGKDVFAVPGNINSIFSVGTNKLIRDGAKLVTCLDDIIEEIPSLKALDNGENTIKKSLDNLTINEALIINFINEGEKSIDELLTKTGLSINELLSTLTMLEMKGIIKQLSGKKFIMS